MPANLNALVRYKTIDRCLRNRFICCDIRRLQEECSEALGESRGRKQQVSERTIRDDIRVMRSDILEFNAPIVFKDGGYAYSDPDFSLFNISPKNQKVIEQVIGVLWTNREVIRNPELEYIVEELSRITGTAPPSAEKSSYSECLHEVDPHDIQYLIVTREESEETRKNEERKHKKKPAVLKDTEHAFLREGVSDSSFEIKASMSKVAHTIKPVITWGSILEII